jgi:hypothetical protein
VSWLVEDLGVKFPMVDSVRILAFGAIEAGLVCHPLLSVVSAGFSH